MTELPTDTCILLSNKLKRSIYTHKYTTHYSLQQPALRFYVLSIKFQISTQLSIHRSYFLKPTIFYTIQHCHTIMHLIISGCTLDTNHKIAQFHLSHKKLRPYSPPLHTDTNTHSFTGHVKSYGLILHRCTRAQILIVSMITSKSYALFSTAAHGHKYSQFH